MPFSGSIRNKIWICVLVALVGYLIATISSYYSNNKLAQNLSYLRETPFPLSIHGGELLNIFEKQTALYEDAFVMGEIEPAEQGNLLSKDILTLFNKMIEIIQSEKSQHKQLLIKLRKEYTDYFALASEVYISTAEAEDVSFQQEKIHQLGKAQASLHKALNNMANTFIENVERHVEADKERARNSTYFLMGLFIFVLLAATLIINKIAMRLLIQPLEKIQNMVHLFAKGKTVKKPEIALVGDEIGILADSFYNMTEILKKTTVSKDYVDNIIKSMSDCLIVLSPEAFIQTANQTAIDLLGYSEKELIGEPVEKLFCEADDFIFNKSGLGRLLKDKTIHNVEACFFTKSGQKIPILFSGAVMTGESETTKGIVCVIRDITELKKAEEALKSSYGFLKTVVNSLNESVSIINVHDYTVESANKVFLENFNLKEEDVVGKVCHKLIRGFDEPCAPPDHKCPLQDTIETKQFSVVEHAIESDDGSVKHLEISTSPIFNKNNELIQVVHVSRDITESKIIKKQLEQMAHFDELTNLPNRTLFFDRVHQALSEAKRYNKKLSLFFLDLDNFKPINDTMGHDAGDEVLKEAAARLRKCVRDCDTVGRMGGDEFTVLISNLDDFRGAEIVAERILKFFSIPFTVLDTDFNVGVSIGISFYPKDADNADTLVKSADTAMYWAKQKGKNTFCLHYSEN